MVKISKSVQDLFLRNQKQDDMNVILDTWKK